MRAGILIRNFAILFLEFSYYRDVKNLNSPRLIPMRWNCHQITKINTHM
jgi:hypothetical protein